MFLITSAPYSGTKYTYEYLQQHGFDIGHEQYGKDGIVSWKHSTPFYYDRKSIIYRSWAKNNRVNDNIEAIWSFDIIIHQTRNPIDCISSIATHPGILRDDGIFSFIPMTDDEITRAMVVWLYFNDIIEMYTKKQFCVENIDKLHEYLDFEKKNVNIPKDIHSKKHRENYRKVTEKELMKKNRFMYERVKEKAEKYGY